jgi:hypothetical protein
MILNIHVIGERHCASSLRTSIVRVRSDLDAFQDIIASSLHRFPSPHFFHSPLERGLDLAVFEFIQVVVVRCNVLFSLALATASNRWLKVISYGWALTSNHSGLTCVTVLI